MTDQPETNHDDELTNLLVAEFDEHEPVDKQLVLAIPGHQITAQRFRAVRLERSTLEEICEDDETVGFHAETRVFFLFEPVPPEGSDVAYQERHEGTASSDG